MVSVRGDDLGFCQGAGELERSGGGDIVGFLERGLFGFASGIGLDVGVHRAAACEGEVGHDDIEAHAGTGDGGERFRWIGVFEIQGAARRYDFRCGGTGGGFRSVGFYRRRGELFGGDGVGGERGISVTGLLDDDGALGGDAGAEVFRVEIGGCQGAAFRDLDFRVAARLGVDRENAAEEHAALLFRLNGLDDGVAAGGGGDLDVDDVLLRAGIHVGIVDNDGDGVIVAEAADRLQHQLASLFGIDVVEERSGDDGVVEGDVEALFEAVAFGRCGARVFVADGDVVAREDFKLNIVAQLHEIAGDGEKRFSFPVRERDLFDGRGDAVETIDDKADEAGASLVAEGDVHHVTGGRKCRRLGQ